MSRRQIDSTKDRLAAESGVRANPWGGRLSVALVYPNSYHQGMSNLGFQTVYRLLNQRDDTLCERFFLPDRDATVGRPAGRLSSIESDRPLVDFDLVAFSISFENDYLNLPRLFQLARLPLLRRERDERHPLLLCGGVCAFLNPEPLAELMDLFAVGEAEVLLAPLIETLLRGDLASRNELLDALAQLPGIYSPGHYRADFAPDGTLTGFRVQPPAPKRVRRQWLADLDAEPTSSALLTEATEFGDMFLTEVSRGCSRGCRFCAAGFLYLPVRERSLETLEKEVDRGLCERRKIGLVGAAVSDYPEINELNRRILAAGGQISVASLRIDALDRAEVEALRQSGHRTVAIAPEAGSQRMRDLINKGLDEGQILAAAELLAQAGIPNLKLYFLIGLPTEEMADVEAIAGLAEQVRDRWLDAGRRRGRVGQVTLSVNPFVPKPFTPLQWAPMEPVAGLKRKIALLRGRITRQPHLELHVESPREALLQAVLSRGDRRLGPLLPRLAAGESLAAVCREIGLKPDFYAERQRGADEIFPWEVLDSGVRRDYLWREYRQALSGLPTPRCFPGCRRCGVCL